MLMEKYSQIDIKDIKVNDKCFVHVINNNEQYHPTLTKPVAIYLNDFNNEYILPIGLYDQKNLKIENINTYLNFYKEIYVIDKKYSLNYIDHPHINDIGVYYWLSKGKPLINLPPNSLNAHYQRLYPNKQYNKLIPIEKHLEHGNKLFEEVKEYILEFKYNPFYNDLAIETFLKMDSYGVKLNPNKFSFTDTKLSIKNNQHFGVYDFKTTTGRPKNHFNNLNIMGLSKSTGIRENIVPKYDLLAEIDFQAFHPNIVAYLTNYSYNGDLYESIINELGREFTEENRKEIKENVFWHMYGSDTYEEVNSEFFDKVEWLKEDIWDKFNQNKLTLPFSDRILYKVNYPKVNKSQLFSYYIQGYETEQNIVNLDKILNIIEGKKVDLILYQYDSFLFDLDEENLDLIFNINKLLNFSNYKTTLKTGKNYQELS